MSEVLSQSQIDALLSSLNAGGAGSSPPAETQEKKYRKYDFNSPRKFTKDRIRMLNGIFDNYARILNTRINGLLRTSGEVKVESVEEQRYYEFSNALTEGAVVALAHLHVKQKKDTQPVIFYITTPVMISMMDRMLGGDGDVEDDLPYDYSYTNMELRLYENLMKDFASFLGTSWENYIQLNFEFNRVETNPTLVQLIGLDETVVLIDLNIQFPNCEGQLSICFPGVLLTNIFTEINAQNPVGLSSSEDSAEQIFDNLRSSSLEIVAELGRTTLQLDDIYGLNVGDVVDLNKKKDSAVHLRIGNQLWFDGLLGVNEKKIAVKINRVHHNAGRKDS